MKYRIGDRVKAVRIIRPLKHMHVGDGEGIVINCLPDYNGKDKHSYVVFFPSVADYWWFAEADIAASDCEQQTYKETPF